MERKYQEAAAFFPSEIRTRLSELPEDLQPKVREICLRSGRPLIVSTLDGDYFLRQEGGFSRSLPGHPYLVSPAELQECVRILTGYSLHSCQQEINEGYLTVQGGHRVGIAGTCVSEGGKILTIRDYSSLNFRIARQIAGVAEELARALYAKRVCSTLLVGAPASGKTTLLKDLARCLSSGVCGRFFKLSLIDERGELAAVSRGVPQNDLGPMTDVFDGYEKGEGMSMAIRSMSPHALILDEIAGERDAASIRQCLNAGVAVIATAHAASLDELCRKTHILTLLEEGAFEKIILLDGPSRPCRIRQIVQPEELMKCCG